jgi:hypothetical protein
MLRVCTAVLSAAVLSAATPAARADEPKDVITRAIKAHGGEEALTKYQAAQARNKGKITIPGVGDVEFTQQVSYMLPDKFRESMELDVGGQKVNVETVVNGDKATIEVNGNVIDTPDQVKTALKDARYLLKLSRLVPLVKDKGYELSPVGEVKVEGKPAIGVRVSAKDQKDVNVYFDKETGLIAKLEHRTVELSGGNEVTEERIVVGYQKTKQGLPAPKKLLVKHDGKTFMEAEVLEINFLEKLDESEFKK